MVDRVYKFGDPRFVSMESLDVEDLLQLSQFFVPCACPCCNGVGWHYTQVSIPLIGRVVSAEKCHMCDEDGNVPGMSVN